MSRSATLAIFVTLAAMLVTTPGWGGQSSVRAYSEKGANDQPTKSNTCGLYKDVCEKQKCNCLWKVSKITLTPEEQTALDCLDEQDISNIDRDTLSACVGVDLSPCAQNPSSARCQEAMDKFFDFTFTLREALAKSANQKVATNSCHWNAKLCQYEKKSKEVTEGLSKIP